MPKQQPPRPESPLWETESDTADAQQFTADQAAADSSEAGRSTAAQGEIAENPLSEREMDVARLLTTGATNSEIARELTISPNTVKVHLRNVFEKLQVSSRTEASMVLLQRGWVGVPGGDGANRASHAAPSVDPAWLPPLNDQMPAIAPWQRVYLLFALVLALIAALTPLIIGRPRPAFTLLSDAGQTVIGRPSVELLPRWEARTPLSQARSRMAVALDSQQIYVVGGEGSNGRILQSVDSYDLQVNQWRPLPPLPQPLANSAAVILNGRLYVAGGVTPGTGNPTNNEPPAGAAATPPDATPPGDTAANTAAQADGIPGVGRLAVSDTLFMYEGVFRAWQARGALPAPLAGAQLLADDAALYLLGGWDGATMRDEVWRWQPSAATPAVEWELLARLPSPRAFFGAARVEETLYIAGGYDGEQELADVHRYHLETGEWETLAPLTVARGGLTLAYDGVALVALGGGWTRPVSDHERYDAVTDQWTTIPSPIPGEWRHLGAVSREGVIHLLGGWSGDYLDTHLQYQSSFRALLPVITSD